mmetsp:Transcript_13731/g.45835  ORF Transcript_13731/g.45835 Transcript_13731/m.45835 type:complete len:201 (-) Transcript_13731:405-1007(-)
MDAAAFAAAAVAALLSDCPPITGALGGSGRGSRLAPGRRRYCHAVLSWCAVRCGSFSFWMRSQSSPNAPTASRSTWSSATDSAPPRHCACARLIGLSSVERRVAEWKRCSSASDVLDGSSRSRIRSYRPSPYRSSPTANRRSSAGHRVERLVLDSRTGRYARFRCGSSLRISSASRKSPPSAARSPFFTISSRARAEPAS